MERLLKKHGYTVSEAINGRGALKKASEESPDVVLLDVMMPDMSGWDVCKSLKDDPKTSQIPIIMLTVMAEAESIKKSFEEAGADWHVSKPFDVDLLFFILEMAAKRDRKNEIERKMKKLVSKDKLKKKVFEMINPKILDYKYDFLKNR
jgi:response regulator RpfG family c-di-GMP phosphodiesterase